MAFKSKFIISTLLLSLVSSPLASASPSDLSPSARPIPSVCDLSNPSKPKGCSTIDIVSLIATEIKKYDVFSQATEPTYRYITEFDGCVVTPLQISWKQYFGTYSEPLNYIGSLTAMERQYQANYLAEIAKSQLDWIKLVEERRKKLNFDDYKLCVEREAKNLSFGPFEAYIYKREWSLEYHDVFEKYFSASRESSKTKAIPQTELFKQFLPELISIWETTGKQRVNDHYEILKMIKLYSEVALIVVEQEKRNIATEKKNAEAKAQIETATKVAAEKAAAEAERKKQLAADQANARARAKVLASGGCINKVTGGAIANGQRSFGNTCVNGRLIADKPAASTSQSGSCQDPTSGMLVKNGASIKYSDGTRTCVNGRWSNPTKSGGSSGGKTLVSKTCTISTTGLTSDWNGAQYSWTIWNNWSDGSRTVATMGSGYLNSVPYGC